MRFTTEDRTNKNRGTEIEFYSNEFDACDLPGDARTGFDKKLFTAMLKTKQKGVPAVLEFADSMPVKFLQEDGYKASTLIAPKIFDDD